MQLQNNSARVGRQQHHPRPSHNRRPWTHVHSHSRAPARVSARECLTDINRFITYASSMGTPVPKTFVVKKGAVLPSLQLEYPLWVKAAEGGRTILCSNAEAKKIAIKTMCGEAFQLQEALGGFASFRVLYAGKTVNVFKQVASGSKINNEKIMSGSREYVLALGVTRRISASVLAQGVSIISFHVAIRQETALVTGCTM